MKIFTPFKTFALLLALSAGTASAQEFSYTENFDDDASFTASADLPDGWTSTTNSEAIKRYQGSYLGSGTNSGNYVLGTLSTTSMGRSSWVFSKMLTLKGGTKYTVKFYLKMPGGSAAPFNNNVTVKAGTAQSEDGLTVSLGETGATKLSDWTEQSYEFTPEADGDYCIGINVATQLYQAGYVAIDDFEVTGDESGSGSGSGETPVTPTEQQTYLEETFDLDDHFTDATTVPTGWVSTGDYPFARQKGTYFGLDNHSGDYVFGTLANSSAMSRNEFFCTPLISMKAGQEYTLSFWYKAPGGASKYYATQILTKVGTAQESAAMTTTLGETPQESVTEWTQATYKFTPEADGDYCFGFNLLTQLFNAGSVVIDDITVTGPKVSPDAPEDKTVCEIPYSQSFDNENSDYDGQHYVPNGWLATGTSPFVTANISDLEAKDGTYYVIAPESSIARDDRLYTSFFYMEKGVTYQAKFWLYMPGDGSNASDFDFTVGTEQDSEFHTSIYSLPSYTNKEWTEHTVTFTPEESDFYCFSFALGGEQTQAGEVCIDLFTLTQPGKRLKPHAAFSYGGYYDLMNSHLIAFSNTTLQMANQSTDADTYLWEAEGAEPSTSTEANPTFTFPASGTYTVRLTATNEVGETTTTADIDVENLGDEYNQLPVGAYNPGQDKIQTRDNMFAYATASDADWVTGINHHYTHFAEKFDLPEGREYNITSLTLYLCYYNIASRYYSAQAQKPLNIVIYPVTDGLPDLDHPYGKYATTMNGAFGTTGLSKAELRGITFDYPIVAKGPFFLAFEFSDELWIDEPDANLSRTVVGFGGAVHRTGNTSLYVQPTSVPDGCTYAIDGQYCPVDSLGSDYKGLGLNLTAWMNVAKEGTATSIAVTPNGSVAYAARIDGNVLTVSGTTAGDDIHVYTTAGQTVAHATATDGSTTLTLDAQPGLYVVSTAAGSLKVVKQ